MLQITSLSENTYLLYGKRNDYIISKRYSGQYAVIPVNNNPTAEPLMNCKSLDDCIRFLDMADKAESIA